MTMTDVDLDEAKGEFTYASIAKLFEDFGVHTNSAAIARSYKKWTDANRSRIDQEADKYGLSSDLNGELGTLFMPDVIRDEFGPSVKMSIMCGESSMVDEGTSTEAKLAAVQAAVDTATENLQEAPGGEANLQYVRLLYDSTIEAAGNSTVLNTCSGWVHAIRVTNDYFVDKAAFAIGKAVALRGVRALIEASEASNAQTALDEFKMFAEDILCNCFCAGRITHRECSRIYKMHALAFVDGKIDLEGVANGVSAGITRRIAFFFDRAAHDRRAHILALDPHRMSWISSIYGTDMSQHRVVIATAMSSM